MACIRTSISISYNCQAVCYTLVSSDAIALDHLHIDLDPQSQPSGQQGELGIESRGPIFPEIPRYVVSREPPARVTRR